MVFQQVGSLSGGERSRAALAQLAASDSNFLILDEPTNHLDLWARDALERALLEFNGTVLFVSHDRYFLNRVADHLLVVEPGRFRVVEGNYDFYQHLVREGLAGADTDSKAVSRGLGPKPAPAAKKPPPAKSSKPKRRFPYRKVADLEAEIFEREARIEELHQALLDPEVLRSGPRVRDINAEVAEQTVTLATLYEHWEEATELN
jgi:ATP-binding cassette subfamily F protein 3